MKSNFFVLILRLILGGIFVYAGVDKVGNPAAFADDIDNYRMLPYIFVSLMAIILPWIEIVAGLLLIFGKFIHGASFTLIVLNIVFIIAIASALARGLDIECGCFSVGENGAHVGVLRLIEDFVFIVMAVLIYRSKR